MVEIYSKVESVHRKMSKSFKSSQPSPIIKTSKCAQTAFTMSEKIRQKDQSGKISWRLKPLKNLTQNYEMFICVFPIVNTRDS